MRKIYDVHKKEKELIYSLAFFPPQGAHSLASLWSHDIRPSSDAVLHMSRIGCK